jgi:membrane associated rhomboid family serine protease
VSPYGPSRMQYSFGPGPISPAVRALIVANVAMFVLTLVAPDFVIGLLGLTPADVIGRAWVWQLVTYLFVHSPTQISHILFNMLAVWMFGVELERRWGTREFVKFYFFTGVAAGLSMIAVSLLPFDATRATYGAVTIGASGAVYGLLMAWAILFPHRQILFMMIFPLPARAFVAIMGAIAFFSAVGASGGPVANVAHLGGLVFGYVYLKGPSNLRLELRYRMTKWRMDRMRRKFNVHKGGRDDWDKHIH